MLAQKDPYIESAYERLQISFNIIIPTPLIIGFKCSKKTSDHALPRIFRHCHHKCPPLINWMAFCCALSLIALASSASDKNRLCSLISKVHTASYADHGNRTASYTYRKRYNLSSASFSISYLSLFSSLAK